MSTKKELEEQVKFLKDELRKYIDLSKEVEAKKQQSVDDLPNVGVGIIKDDDGKFKRVELKFCPVSKSAVVSNITEASHLPTDRIMSEFGIEEFLRTEIFKGY